jgi:hypothetical protein
MLPELSEFQLRRLACLDCRSIELASVNQMLDFTFGNAAKAIRITGHRELQGSDRLRTPSVVVPGMQTCFAGRHSGDADGIADITLLVRGEAKP